MTDILNINKYKHFFLDYDGLIADTEKLYFETWCQVLTKKGQEICRDFHEGKHQSEVYEKVKHFLLKKMTLEEVSEYRKSTYDKYIVQGRLDLIDGMWDFLKALNDKAPLSIVSNSTEDVVENGIKTLRIEKYFDNLFCFDDTLNRKPAPDIYNLAISALNLDRSSVLAFEDSISGILAAQSAGIPVICINSSPQMAVHCKKNNIRYYKSSKKILLDA